MKVAQINSVYGILSTGRTSKETYDFLVNNGHECVTFYGEHFANFGSEAIFLGSRFSHKIHAFIGRLFGNTGIGSWSSTKKLISRLKRFRPDIVHLRNLHSNYVHIPMLLKFLSENDIATVVQLHDCYLFTGGCTHYTANQCDKWKTECENCKFLKCGADYFFTNNAKNNLRLKKKLFGSIPRLSVIGVSKWTAIEAKKSAVFSSVPLIDYVYNWVDLKDFIICDDKTNEFTRTNLGLNKEDKMVLGVASFWTKEKGLFDFFKLRDLLPSNMKIFLLGYISPKIKLPDGIFHIKSTSSKKQLSQLYSASDVFVNLSIEETFGKVLAEALACGTPAIAYNSTAIPEIIGDDCGYIVSMGDIEKISKLIIDINKSDFQKQCRKRAEELFNMKINLSKLLDIYRRTIELSV